MSAPLLSVQSLVAGYGDIVALRDVSIDVAAGEVVAVLGPNGAGKTTLLGTVAGIQPSMSGQVALDGNDLGRMRAHKRVKSGISLVQENKRIFARMTVRDNLVVSAPRVSPAEFAQRLDESTSFFPILGTFMDRPAGEMSGGQQQMLAIAQALMARPRVLLLDEPSAGLSPKLTSEVMNRVVDIARTGIGVLLVEQAVHEAIRVANRVYTLRLGRSSEQEDFLSADKLQFLEGLYLS
jgi:branched-chain amino acid transport system ATP-binding protein